MGMERLVIIDDDPHLSGIVVDWWSVTLGCFGAPTRSRLEETDFELDNLVGYASSSRQRGMEQGRRE